MYCEKNKQNNQIQEILDAKQGGLAFSTLMAIYVLISFLIQSILLGVLESDSFAYLAICSLLSIISIAIILLYYCVNKKHTIKVLGINKCDYKGIILSIVLCVGMFFGLGFVNSLFTTALHSVGVKVSTPNIKLENVWHFIYFSITLALFPAIFEELFFRGLLLSSLEKTSTLAKVIASGVMFALYHCSLSQFVYQFIYGALLALIVIVFKSVIPCIVAHFLNNFAVLFFEYFKVNIDLYNAWVIATGLICLALFIGAIIYFVQKGQSDKAEQNDSEEKQSALKLYVPYGIFGILICVIMIISVLFI